MAVYSLHQWLRTLIFHCHGFQHRGLPDCAFDLVVLLHAEVYLGDKNVSTGPISLVDDIEIGNLHDPSFHALNYITQTWSENHNSSVCGSGDVNFILAHANSLNYYPVFAKGVHDLDHLSGRPRHTTYKED